MWGSVQRLLCVVPPREQHAAKLTEAPLESPTGTNCVACSICLDTFPVIDASPEGALSSPCEAGDTAEGCEAQSRKVRRCVAHSWSQKAPSKSLTLGAGRGLHSRRSPSRSTLETTSRVWPCRVATRSTWRAQTRGSDCTIPGTPLTS